MESNSCYTESPPLPSKDRWLCYLQARVSCLWNRNCSCQLLPNTIASCAADYCTVRCPWKSILSGRWLWLVLQRWPVRMGCITNRCLSGKAWEEKLEWNPKTFQDVYNMNANADPLHLERKISKAHSKLWSNISTPSYPLPPAPLYIPPSLMSPKIDRSASYEVRWSTSWYVVNIILNIFFAVERFVVLSRLRRNWTWMRTAGSGGGSALEFCPCLRR